MIDGMESYIGKKLKAEYIEKYKDKKYIVTRPDYYSTNMHINMTISFDSNYCISDIDGDKCYSYDRGMYNRSSAIYDRNFTKRDVAFLRKFIKEITEQ